MAELTSMLLRIVMLVVVKGVLLLGHVHSGESLVTLPSIHHVLLLKSILTIDSEIVYHSAGGRSGGRRRIV